ncbi:hypothetical protein P4O66_015447, partial [Electrophorus voltai]
MCMTYGLSSALSCRTPSIANWRNASSITKRTAARLLTDLLCGITKRLRWGPKAERFFSELKEAFSTTLVLQQPDLEKHFVVGVDALDIGARREERECGHALLETPHRSPVYQHGASTFTHVFPGNTELGPGPTGKDSKSASALPAKPPLCPSLPLSSPYHVGTHLHLDKPPRSNPYGAATECSLLVASHAQGH